MEIMAKLPAFAVWLKVEREARGWTQAEAAAVVGVAPNTWARWERGEIVPPLLTQSGIRTALEQRGKRGG
jgi:transcriptional regulator with XRE-family HTH domain